jgi:hypothetical protein
MYLASYPFYPQLITSAVVLYDLADEKGVAFPTLSIRFSFSIPVACWTSNFSFFFSIQLFSRCLLKGLKSR